MNRWIRRFELPLVAALCLAGSAFLLKLAYLSIFTGTVCGAALLLVFYGYVRQRYGVKIPIVLLGLALVAIEVDTFGNYFRMYDRHFGLIEYDQISHFVVQALISPILVWLLRKGIEHFGYRLPLGLLVFFAITLAFSISGFYEVIELWDDRYFGGTRIKDKFDTSHDLQSDLAGSVLGAVATYAVLKLKARTTPEVVQAIGASIVE